MDAHETQMIASTLRRCARQFARPAGVTSDEVRRAEELGLLKFNEWPSGHFKITERGMEFLSECSA